MNRFMTEKAAKAAWWEVPVMVVSGFFTAIGIRVLATEFGDGDVFVSVMAGAVFLLMLSWPLLLTLRRRHRRRQAKALSLCLSRLRNSFVTYGELNRRSGVLSPEKKLQWMLGKGWIQNILLDDAHACVRVADDQAPEAAAPASAPEPAEAPADLPVTGNPEYDARLREIRDLNDRIADRAVSDKIDRIEALTADIFGLIADHPDRSAEIRRFMNYYLPTTFKLLESYSLMEKQRYQGESIRASRGQIESVLDQIIRAIERQQDRLFQSDALDVETDISVLKTMMSADGLTGEGGLHL